MSFPSTFNNPKKNIQTEDEIEQMEHKYPFKASVRIDNSSINEQQVNLNVRRPSEFNIEARLVFDPEYKQRLLHAKHASKTPNMKGSEEKKR